MNSKNLIAMLIFNILENEKITFKEIKSLLRYNKILKFGDISLPIFYLKKFFINKTLNDISFYLIKNIKKNFFIEKIKINNLYLNFFINRKKLSNIIINKILFCKYNYGFKNIGNMKKIIIDMSSPNIAKPFSMGHLRSTVIGNSLSLIFEKIGYKVIRFNHLGDWGTQFGKLIVGYKRWIKNNNNILLYKNNDDIINILYKIYVKFYYESKNNINLEKIARNWFLKLERNDIEAIKIWKLFRNESIKKINKLYKFLNIKFNYCIGESFYNKKINNIINLLKLKKLLFNDKKSLIVKLKDVKLKNALIRKENGSSLYLTRDLAAILFKKKIFNFYKMLYIVGNEQTYYFKQFIAILKKINILHKNQVIHIGFGMIRKNGKKLSTRKGKIILLEKILDKIINLIYKKLKFKNLCKKKNISIKLGISSVIFNDLKNDRLNDIDFSLEEITKFEGDTGIYIQYTYVRLKSILNKNLFRYNKKNIYVLDDDYSWEIIKMLQNFEEIILLVIKNYEPSILAKYILKLSRLFNKYYSKFKILNKDFKLQSKLALVYSISIVLKEGLRLLGIEVVNKM